METKEIKNNFKVVPLNKKIVSRRIIQEPLPCPVSNNNEPFLMIISSKIGSGKSILVSNLMKIYSQYFTLVFFASSNVKVNETNGKKELFDLAYKDKFNFNQDRLFDDFNDDVMNDILEQIKEFEKSDEFEEKTNPQYLLIVDDLSQAFLKLKSLITKTVLRLRHIKLSFIVITQRFRNINPSIRGQCNFMIAYSTQNQKEIEAMSEVVDSSFEKFKKLLEFATQEPYNFLFIDSSKNPSKMYRNFNEQIINL